MTGEPTEMAGVAEAQIGSIYAWELDYDDPDEFPTTPIRRMTPRRVTALGIAASLVAVAAAGVIAIASMHAPASTSTIAQTVVAPPTVTEMMPPPVTTTVMAAPLPPPPPPPPPSVAVATPTPTPRDRYPYADEAGFVSAVRGHMPQGWIPGHTVVNGSSVPATDAQLIDTGYRACRMRDDQYGGDSVRAARAFFTQDSGYDPGDSQWPMTFFSYINILCNSEIG
jgi:hypothetical protein